MTDQNRIAEIKARCERATPGPWAWYEIAREIFTENGVPVVAGTEGNGVAANDDDFEFIIHAREDIPFLLAQLAERQRREKAAVECIEEAGRALKHQNPHLAMLQIATWRGLREAGEESK